MPKEINYKLGDHGETPIEVVRWIKKEVKGMKYICDGKEKCPYCDGHPPCEVQIGYEQAIEDVAKYLGKLLK